MNVRDHRNDPLSDVLADALERQAMTKREKLARAYEEGGIDGLLDEMREPDIPMEDAGSGKLGEAPDPCSAYAARTCWQAMLDKIK